MNLGAIYPSLHKLEEEGLVQHRMERGQEGRPERKVYEITADGRAELTRWRPLEPAQAVQWKNPLLLKLFFAKPENYPDAIAWIEKDLETLRATLSAIQGELANPKAFRSPAVDFIRQSAVAHTEVQIELLSEFRERLQKLIARDEEVS